MDKNSGAKNLQVKETSPLITSVDGTTRRLRRPPKIHETCPTCQGRGKIPKEQCEPEMMALIPYGDQRLKPRRTKLVMGITFVVTAVCIGVLMALFYPKSVAVSLQEGHAHNLSVVCQPTPNEHDIAEVFMTVNWTIQVHNPNFLPITLNDGHVLVYTIYNQLVGNFSLESMSFTSRSDGFQVMDIPVSILDKDAARIWQNNCVRGITRPYNTFPLSFNFNATSSVMSFNSVVEMSSLVLVSCPIPSSPIGPPVPVNTTTTTTKPPYSLDINEDPYRDFELSGNIIGWLDHYIVGDSPYNVPCAHKPT